MKRWLTQAMNERWVPGSGRPGSLECGARGWAAQGSNKAIKDVAYLNNAYRYIAPQRTADS